MICDRLVHWSVWVIAAAARRLPKQLAMFLGSGIGVLYYFAAKRRRQIALENLQLVFGCEKSDAERKEICLGHFRNLGKTAIEFLRFPKLTDNNIWREVAVEGKENLIGALDGGKGAIVFLPHFGNWELLALVYGVLIPNRAKAIALPIKNEFLNSFVWKYRQQLGLKLIPRKRAVRETIRALRNNFAVGFFADQNAGKDGVFVDFFGKKAASVRGPATLALKSGAPILFSIDVRQHDDRHRVIISPPVELEISGDFEQDVRINTTRLLKILESYIHQYPSQWLWLHNRWKTQPDR